MTNSKKAVVLTTALAAAAGGFVPGLATATAAPTSSDVVVGPGSPMRMPFTSNEKVEGRYVGTPMCSLGVPGTVVDQNGVSHRVIMTAGHCVMAEDLDTGDKVTGQFYIPTKNGDKLLSKGFVGTDTMPDEDSIEENPMPLEFMDMLFNSADYGIIEVQDDVKTTSMSQSVDEFGGVHGEPVQIVGIEDKPDLQPMEVSFDNLGEPVCTDGSRTGRGCGVQIFRVRNGIWAISPIDHGDSGGNAFNPETREAIGVNSMGIGPVSRFQPIDIALEEQYGIPDGQVNDRFKVETSTEPQSEFRTIDEDSKFSQEHTKPEMPDLGPIGDLIPDSPSLPDSPALPESDSQSIPIAGAETAPQINVSNVTEQAHSAVNNLTAQAGLPNLF